MRMYWRVFTFALLVGIWPQLGCHQLPTGQSVQDLRPIQVKEDAVVKQNLTAAEVGQSLLAKAKSLEDAQKFAEAVAMYEKIRATDPAQGWQATKKLGLLYLHHNELDRAEQEFEFLHKHNPRDADILCALGDISYRRGYFGSAEKYFRDAISRKPDHAHAIINLGMTLAQREQYKESLETFKRVLPAGEAHCQVAWVMNLNGKHEDAIREYQIALNFQPDLHRAKQELTQVYQTQQTATVRMTTPHRVGSRGLVELEPGNAFVANEGSSRLMMQRPTLPPLPDFDLGEDNGRDWQTSAKTK